MSAEIPAIWGYFLVFLIAWMENVFPPIPGDLLIVFAGYLAAVGPLSLYGIILFSTLGGTLGFMCMYFIGWYGGPRLLESRLMRWIPKEYVFRVQNWIHVWGLAVVAANRFLSGARTVIACTVGMSRMQAVPVGVMAFLSAFVWVTLIAVLGYMVGDEWERIGDYLSQYGRSIFMLICLFLVWQFYKMIRDLRKKS